jgi:hypothetical protein
MGKLTATVVTAAMLTGCATLEDPEAREQATGAAIGCVGGAIIGALLGNARGAAAGCAAGALAGWAAVKVQQYNAAQARTSEADLRRYRKSDPDFYGLNAPVTSSAVKIRSVKASPATVSPGALVVVKTDYSVVTPAGAGDATVNESWALKKDGKTLTTVKSDPQHRTSGGWGTEAGFPVPADAEPGTYVVEHRVKTGTSYDTRSSTFVVM